MSFAWFAREILLRFDPLLTSRDGPALAGEASSRLNGGRGNEITKKKSPVLRQPVSSLRLKKFRLSGQFRHASDARLPGVLLFNESFKNHFQGVLALA